MTAPMLPTPDPTVDAGAPVLDEAQVREQEEARLKRARAIQAIYGRECPLGKESGDATDAEWAAWPKALWAKHEAGVAPRLHAVQRNRKFRDGDQWVSSTGTGPWREPPRPKDAARMVANVIKPALDQRTQLVIEQRPGFRAKPTRHDAASTRQAEAQQRACEYQYDQQAAEAMIAEASYHAMTDGVCFPCLYWDADRGPWFETGTGDRYQGGEISAMVYTIEQVRVSANASATRKPTYWVIKETLSQSEAVARYGDGVLQERTGYDMVRPAGRATGTDTTGEADTRTNDLLQDQETVDRYTVYCEPTDPYLPDGLVMIVVGDAIVVPPAPLPWGCVPVFRWTDGAPSPAFYPPAQMEDWIADQQLINAALSKWVESVRRNAGGQLAVLGGKVSEGTLGGGLTNLIEVRGVNAITEAIQQIPGFSIGNDVKELIQFAIQNFEKKSGWNDATRGSFSSDTSGRSVLAQREVVERTFAPIVRAAASAMRDWAKITLHFMRWGYSEPRRLALAGNARSDLALEVTAETFDGIADVEIDAETMMPMPRSLRLFLLGDLYDKQVISPAEYRRRLPFAFTGEIESPDEDHYARAKRLVHAIRTSANPMALPMLWQDDEAIAQDVLERDLILPDDTDPMVRDAAIQRWTMLAEQAQMKQGGMPMQGDPAAMQGGGTGQGLEMPAGMAPLAMMNPSTAAAPLAMTDESTASAFDAQQAA